MSFRVFCGFGSKFGFFPELRLFSHPEQLIQSEFSGNADSKKCNSSLFLPSTPDTRQCDKTNVNADEKLPLFAGLKLQVLCKKNITRSRRLRPCITLSFCKSPLSGLLYGNDAEACPDRQRRRHHHCS